VRDVVFGTGSQRPLQQLARDVQATPGPAHAPGSRHVLPSQRNEQQSEDATQVAPFDTHARPGGVVHDAPSPAPAPPSPA